MSAILTIAFLWIGNTQAAGAAVALLFTGLALLFASNKKLASYAYTLFIAAAVSLALSFPEYFISVNSFPLKKAIVPLLQLIMLGVGCTLSLKDLAIVIKTPKKVAIGVICQFTIMPFVGLGLATVFGFPPEIAAGLILVGCMPGGLASNVIAFLSKANVALSVTLTTVSTLLAPLATPFLMKALGGQLVPIDAGAMFLDILKMVIGPVFLGLGLHYLLRRHMALVHRIMPVVSMVGIVFIIMIITAAGRDSLLKIGLSLILAVCLHMSLGLALGYFSGKLFGLSETDSRTIGIEVGMQNSGLASGLAVQMGKIATVGLAAAVNGPVMNTLFSLVASWWGRKAIPSSHKQVI